MVHPVAAVLAAAFKNDAIRKCSKTWLWMSDFSRHCFEDIPCSKHKIYVLLTPTTDKCWVELLELNVVDDDALTRCAGSELQIRVPVIAGWLLASAAYALAL